MKNVELNVLTYNIHKGFSGSMPRRLVLDQVRDAVRKVEADLVFLQEVQGRHDVHARTEPNWPAEPQFEFLAERTWPHFAYGHNSIYNAGHHGNAILSKYPFESWDNIDASMGLGDHRGILHGVMRVSKTAPRVHVVCTHFGLLERFRRWQSNELCRRIAEAVPEDEPLIVAGDFNDWRQYTSERLYDAARLREVFLELNGRHAVTYPAFWPVFALDRIYVRGLRVLEGRVHSGSPFTELSDHLPISARLLIE